MIVALESVISCLLSNLERPSTTMEYDGMGRQGKARQGKGNENELHNKEQKNME